MTISAVVGDGSPAVRTLHSVPLTRQAKSGMELAVPFAPVEKKPQSQQISRGFGQPFGAIAEPAVRPESGVVVQELPEVKGFTAEAWIRLADAAPGAILFTGRVAITTLLRNNWDAVSV